MNKKMIAGVLGLAFAAAVALPDKGEEKDFARNTMGLSDAVVDRDAYIEQAVNGRAATPSPSKP